MKYSYEKIEDHKCYVWHTEGDNKTLIAITDDIEKAHFLATAANQFKHPESPSPLSGEEIKPFDSAGDLEFAKWLEENTIVIKEEKITLYRYHDNLDGWGNYILEDIYTVYCEKYKGDSGEQQQVTGDIALEEQAEMFRFKGIPTSEPGKVVTGELYRWVKASERLPEKHKDVCFKLDGGSASYYDTGHYTGSYIVLDHFGSKSEDIVEWLEKVEPDWQQLKNQEVEPGQQNQDELWNEHLDSIGNICMYAPIREPDRRNHILKEVKSKYLLIKKDK